MAGQQRRVDRGIISFVVTHQKARTRKLQSFRDQKPAGTNRGSVALPQTPTQFQAVVLSLRLNSIHEIVSASCYIAKTSIHKVTQRGVREKHSGQFPKFHCTSLIRRVSQSLSQHSILGTTETTNLFADLDANEAKFEDKSIIVIIRNNFFMHGSMPHSGVCQL